MPEDDYQTFTVPLEPLDDADPAPYTTMQSQFIHDRTTMRLNDPEDTGDFLTPEQEARAEALRLAASAIAPGILGGGVTGILTMARWIVRGDLNVDYTEAQ